MDLKQQLAAAIQHSAGFTDSVLEEFSEPSDWVKRPCDGTNHALWIVGHLALATDYFIGLVDPEKKTQSETEGGLFGKGTEPQDDLSVYPEPSGVAALLRERRHVLLQVLQDCSEADLAREVTNGPAFVKNVQGVFQTAAWHETLHAGQLSVAHRAIGKPPLADRN